jgi:hypothetical protein
MPLQSGLLIMFYFKTIACSVYKAKEILDYYILIMMIGWVRVNFGYGPRILTD